MYALQIIGTVFIALISIKLAFPSIHRLMVRPALFPFTVAFMMRSAGWLSQLVWKLRLDPNIQEKTSRELIASLKSTRASHVIPLRDAYLALDRLPTVVKGKEALNIKSTFDLFTQKIHNKASPYTHPLQTPHFFIPGVPAKMFYKAEEFEFTQRLEAAYSDIRREVEGLLAHHVSRFQAYAGGHGHVEQGWNNFYFYLFGKKNETNFSLCPKTVEIFDSIPHIDKTMAMFASLNPHSGLPPHTGPANGILRVHLPLIVPENCRLKVGEEERKWEEGKVMVFDDSFIHDVQNNSNDIRVVLFFSIFHPCFSADEIPVLETFSNAWQALPVTKLYESYQHRPRQNNLVMHRESFASHASVVSIPQEN
jgi:aspartyl/asparaginyl beta-hydroxylase (cupin superfamily)